MFCLRFDSYGRDENGFIRDDHRANGSSRQSRNGNKPLTPTRNGKQAKSPRNKGNNNNNNQPKRRNSRQRKQRNQNSKTEGRAALFSLASSSFNLSFIAGTPSINAHESKSTTEHDTTDETKLKHEPTSHTEEPLPPRDHESKEKHDEHKSE